MLGYEYYNDKHVEEHVNRFTFEEFDSTKATETFFQQFVNKLGIYCLTPHNDNILMWSHYAKNSTGYCIGFNTEYLMNYMDGIIEIKYIDQLEIPKIDITRNFYLKTQDLCGQKFSVWKYENEYRLVKISPEERVLHLNPQCINSVVLGPAMLDPQKNEIKSILKKSFFEHVKLYQAKQSSSKFQIEVDEISKD